MPAGRVQSQAQGRAAGGEEAGTAGGENWAGAAAVGTALPHGLALSSPAARGLQTPFPQRLGDLLLAAGCRAAQVCVQLFALRRGGQGKTVKFLFASLSKSRGICVEVTHGTNSQGRGRGPDPVVARAEL